ncbi:putative disease resistance protein RGA4 [Morus notabilis]|uniref:putative disease resistance protein RGA4 n=1 Tax=Morus notabilis TaxID=981085 RepID=UPI000CED491A|nr:putative disease resistance protein RGA4 [Morus notabilis]
MEEIRKTLEEIKTNRTFHLCEKVEEAPLSPILRMRETHSFVRNDEVIGRDDDEKAILKLLLDDTETIENVSLIALVGIGGLGKTTLAQFVFNDEEVQKYFDLKIWVYVSREFDVKLIVRKVIKSITGESLEENPDMDKLQKRVREEIKGKRFMLVLDDVWNEDAEKWHKLDILLKGGASGSRVLITTRSEMVAKITGASRFHKLSGLDTENSLTLFQKTAFLKGKEPMVNLEVAKIGEDIVDKCKGVPLAIKTIGGLLFKRLVCSNDPRKVLMGFKQNELSKIANQNESDSGILPTLKLSYNNLPSHLKRCFVYCGLFPKGFDIQVQTLINQWIAHEFVKPQDNNYRSCLEDLGYNYFMELLMGSFFQEPKEDILGTIHSCKIHDLMHDLAISIAGKGIITLDESSCNYVEMDSSKLDGHGESSFGRALHMFVDFNSLGSCQIPPALLDQKEMRTFISPNSEPLRSSDCDAFLLNFKSLRTFMLCSVYDKKMPKGLGDLKHLRYLDLSGYCNITTLPNSITRLYNLQTLILLGCSNLKSLPQGLQNLIKLRHLKIEGSYLLDHMPRGIGELTSLHTLDLFLVGGNNKVVSKQSGGLGELCKLNNLHGHLTIKFLGDNESVASDSVAACLKDKEHLESLRLRWSRSPDNVDAINNAEMVLDGSQPPKNLKVLEVYEYPGERFSNWLSFLTNLVRLDISFCGRCQYLPPLHRLSSLQQLRLVNLRALKYVSNVEWNMKSYNHLSTSSKSSTISFFPSLRTLHIKGCYNLRGWWPNQIWESNEVVGAIAEHQHQKPSFVNLSRLEISGCPNLKFMPPFPSVENLELYRTSSMILQNTIMLENVAATSECSTSPPLSKLKHLSVACVHDLESFPEAMDNLLCLQYLEFNNCSKLASITEGIGKLVSLQSLGIIFCRSLASLSEGICNLTSLEHLKIINCPSLTSLPEGIGNLKSLQSLKIKDCTNLTSRLEGIDSLTSLGDLTIAKCTSLTSLLEGIGSLSLLRVLSIDECSSLTSLPQEIGSLSSLTNLKIERCVNLILLPEGINNLSSLRELKIEGCTSLTSLSEGTSGLSSLKYLILKGCTSLTSIQERIGCLPSLEDLTIVRCTSLTSLPEGISSLSLLRALTIQECTSLTSLPEGIGNLSSLRYLKIERCTSLTSIPHGICNLPSIKLVNGQRYDDMPLDGLVDYLLDAQKRCRIFPHRLYERRR